MHDFRCSDGLCVKKEFLCDGIRQCHSGEDELSQNCKDLNGTDNRIIGKKKHSHTFNFFFKKRFLFLHDFCFQIQNKSPSHWLLIFKKKIKIYLIWHVFTHKISF